MQGGVHGTCHGAYHRIAWVSWFACLECALPSMPYPLSFHGLL